MMAAPFSSQAGSPLHQVPTPFLQSGFGVFVAGCSPQQTPQIHLYNMLAAGFSDFKKSLLLDDFGIAVVVGILVERGVLEIVTPVCAAPGRHNSPHCLLRRRLRQHFQAGVSIALDAAPVRSGRCCGYAR